MQPPSRSVPKPVSYDVLIISAEDTLAGFTGNLFNSLKERGFRTKVVIDHWELEKEETERFRVFIIVLSDRYAACAFRLDKLAEIVNEFGPREDRRVFPVFLDVKASDVRHQENIIADRLADHKNCVEPERLEKWTKTLTQVADFVGWPFKRSGNKFEYQCIEEITQKVSEHVACSVGLNPRVEKVNALLYSGSDDGVQRVGICGEAGIGKTTVAREVCNSNGGNRFDYCCFVDEVGECLRNNGLVGLIGMLLSKMIGDNDIKFGNANEGMSILEQKVKQKRLFLVFEDIFDQEQLQDIVKLTNCFSSNSKIIITAEKYCFLQCREIKIYEVERFKDEETFELLSLKAFNSKNMKVKYLGILTRAKAIASEVPFKAEMIGSDFRGKNEKECSNILDQCEKIPNDMKQRIVQVSFDALEEDQKKMLIYIALNLKGLKLAEVEDKFCRLIGVCPKDGIKVLLDKSLIKSKHGLVTMHNLTQNVVKNNAQLHDLTQKVVKNNAQLQYHFQQCQLQLSEENMGYGMQERQPASNDGSMICDPMEFESQLYQNYSSSSSQDPS